MLMARTGGAGEQANYDDGYVAGRDRACLELQPFSGVPDAYVWFPMVLPVYEAVRQYEIELVRALPAARLAACAALPEPMAGAVGQAYRAVAAVEGELGDVRRWLDDFVEAANQYAAARPGLRRDSAPPPAWVRVYPDVDGFVEEDVRRLCRVWGRRDVAGMDFGAGWTWEDPDSACRTSQWRVQWLRETGEIFAVRLYEDVPVSWHQRWSLGPVWLLASNVSASTYDDKEPREWLSSIEPRMSERNSLLMLAEAVGQSRPSLTGMSS